VVLIPRERDEVVAQAGDGRTSAHGDGRAGEVSDRLAAAVERVVVDEQALLAFVAFDARVEAAVAARGEDVVMDAGVRLAAAYPVVTVPVHDVVAELAGQRLDRPRAVA